MCRLDVKTKAGYMRKLMKSIFAFVRRSTNWKLRSTASLEEAVRLNRKKRENVLRLGGYRTIAKDSILTKARLVEHEPQHG